VKPRRFPHEVDPRPVQIQARKVHFDVSASKLHWIPGHPVAGGVDPAPIVDQVVTGCG
jgi:uncharacterized protein